MKDFSYYEYPKKHGVNLYPDFNAYMFALKKAIDETPMTTKGRTKAIEGIRPVTQAWFNEAIKPFEAERDQLIQEFWTDCRESLGYTNFLDKEGVLAIEQYVWKQSHQQGLMEVYYTLEKIVKLSLTMILSNRKYQINVVNQSIT